MANERTLFAILENSDKSGVGLHKRAVGDSVSGTNEAPVLAFENKDGQFDHAKIRDEGDPISKALPALIAKDSSGNLKYALVDSDGRLLVNDEEKTGTKKSARASAAGDTSAPVTVVELSLSTDKLYNSIEWSVKATQDTYWKLVQVDDATETVLDDIITGSGQYSFKAEWKNMEFQSGSTGTQKLKVVGEQLSHGKATDLFATVACNEY